MQIKWSKTAVKQLLDNIEENDFQDYTETISHFIQGPNNRNQDSIYPSHEQVTKESLNYLSQ